MERNQWLAKANNKVCVSITFYEDFELAKEGFEIYRAKRSVKTAYRDVKISDNIECVLFDSHVNRADGLGWYVISDRIVSTYVRVKNMVIVITEIKRDGKDIGYVSSKAIEKFCEVLSR